MNESNPPKDRGSEPDHARFVQPILAPAAIWPSRLIHDHRTAGTLRHGPGVTGWFRSAAKPQPNAVRPSSGAGTSDKYTCGSNPEPRTSLKLLRPRTAALPEFIAACEQFRRLQCRASATASRLKRFHGTWARLTAAA